MNKIAATGRLAMVLDLHGHSQKLDAFFYGCDPPAAGAKASRSAAASAAAAAEGAAVRALELEGGEGLLQRGSSKGKHVWVEAGTNDGVEHKGEKEGVEGISGWCSMVVGDSLSDGHAEMDEGGVEAVTAGSAEEGSVPGVAVGRADPQKQKLMVRLLPYFACASNAQYSYEKGKFKVQKGKMGTARVVAAKQLRVTRAYTLEASLGGTTAGGRRDHFSVRNYVQLGKDLMGTLARLQAGEEEQLCREVAEALGQC